MSWSEVGKAGTLLERLELQAMDGSGMKRSPAPYTGLTASLLASSSSADSGQESSNTKSNIQEMKLINHPEHSPAGGTGSEDTIV